ncbi:MAG: transcription termination factor Rho, partial [Lapillicoccus sp.]
MSAEAGSRESAQVRPDRNAQSDDREVRRNGASRQGSSPRGTDATQAPGAAHESAPRTSGQATTGRTDTGRTDTGRTDTGQAPGAHHASAPTATTSQRGATSRDLSSGRSQGSPQGSPPGSGTQGAPGQTGPDDDDDDRAGGRRRNRQRSRDRKRGRPTTAGPQDYEPELQIADDDVLVPVAGILDVLENYAFVRTSGYLPGPNDVYVPLGLVKKNGLRKGDAVTGAVKALREGEQVPSNGTSRQKFNALVRLDSINGATAEDSRVRPDFSKLTPLYPQERLRLETDAHGYTTRVIDLIAPIGKGQRGLIVAPAKAGTTMVLQALANAITANNAECHLMVVLVDERPEEVTDMQRAVKGEVISSTFDRPAEDHTTVAELAIERAKRLVELGHDVVVLLDSLTKLGRAYNLSSPASGRILSGGVDSAALYPPKKFFGTARNIENGGSLTIIATALVDTGSRMDEVIFEEFT